MDISTTALFSLIQEYRFASRALLAELERQFPVRCVVRYHEFARGDNWGIVTGYQRDKLCIWHENGAGWWKPVECATRIDDKSKWPLGIRRAVIRLYFPNYVSLARGSAPMPLP